MEQPPVGKSAARNATADRGLEDYDFFFAARTFAQRALTATAMRARPAADILRRGFVAFPAGIVSGPPSTPASFFSSRAMRSLIATARFNCCTERLFNAF